MSTTEGLNIQQVQDQWKESQRLIDDLRTRLDALASASESAAAAATSIKAGEKSLASLATEQQTITQALAAAQEAAVKTLQSVQEAATSSDAGRLSQQIAEMHNSLSGIETMRGALGQQETALARIMSEVESVKSKQANQDDNIAAMLSMLDSLKSDLAAATTSKDEVASKQEELDELREKIERAISSLPSRLHGKVRDALR